MESMVGALAIFTIGAALVIASWLFLRHNRDPKNYDATKRVATDGGSAATSQLRRAVPTPFERDYGGARTTTG